MISKTCRDVTLRVITPTLKPASGMAPDQYHNIVILKLDLAIICQAERRCEADRLQEHQTNHYLKSF